MKTSRWPANAILMAALGIFISASAAGPGDARTQPTELVTRIQRADYEGNRAALKSLHEQLQPFISDTATGTKLRYWSAFALWRRAINGFNDGTARPELQSDLQQALEEFTTASKDDPAFIDTKIGAMGCLSLLGYIAMENGGQIQDAPIQELFGKMRQLKKDVEAIDPTNPRLLWVMGPNLWKVPPERGGGEAKALEMYNTGLRAIREHKPPSDPLQPSWGEPELLMNLAYSNLNRTVPDLQAAEDNAKAALKLVPYWHYVRDILLPQIEEAKKNAAAVHSNR